MRIEKEGFVLHLEGTWCEISNKYAVLESGDVAVNEEDIPAGFAEKKLDRYGILEQYGFQFPNDEEKGVVEGTSDLYVKKEGAK